LEGKICLPDNNLHAKRVNPTQDGPLLLFIETIQLATDETPTNQRSEGTKQVVSGFKIYLPIAESKLLLRKSFLAFNPRKSLFQPSANLLHHLTAPRLLNITTSA
jgi:hypothetical protein